PPTMVEASFESHGKKLNATMYLANGAGPHPTFVLLHGFPGYERNLDLAQALRRAGFNVLFPHYRGAWGSEGDYTFGHVIEDVASALAWLRREEAKAELRTDPTRLSLVGHSLGGFGALMGGANDANVLCVAALSPANMGPFGRMAAADEGMATAFANNADNAGPLNILSGKAVVDENIANADAWDLTTLGPKLAGKAVLLVAASGDTVLPPAVHHDPVAAAYAAQDGLRFEPAVLDGDHSYSWTRIALMHRVVSWAATNCSG
ncbi:MAG: alpha/beta fold hydrolase, partial [Pseudomonadota bacterium]